MSPRPATYGQQAVWFTEQAGVAGGAYQMALGICFAGQPDERALDEACATIAERHRLLSSAVADVAGTPMLIAAAAKVGLVRAELDDARVRAEIARPFELSRGPLARFTLFSAPDRHLLLITAHHIVFDGASKDVLAHDLAAAYNAARAGEPLHPAPVSEPVSAPTIHDEASVDRARTYWREHWTGPAGPVRLPGLRRAPTGVEPGIAVEVALPPGLADEVGPAARRLGVTRFELLLAALHVLLARYGNAGLPVSVALSTRDTDNAREVGLFVNELPLSVAPLQARLAQYARAVRARLRDLYAVRTVALAQAVRGLRPSVALTPVSVSYRWQGADPQFAAVVSTVDWSLFTGSARNALHLFIVDGDDGPHLTLHSSPSAFDAGAVAQIGAQLITVLAAMLTDPDQPAATVVILPPEQTRRCKSWNATNRPYDREATVSSLLATQVAARPDAVAVTDAGHRLTYGELERAVRDLAGRLHARGVDRGTRVAVVLPRSWRAVVALLAVLRCGAAYVPIDPTYPPARRDHILADAAPTLVIADATDLPEPTDPDASLDDGRARADDVAYVMYTSGSTGRPKGVVVSHGALANLLLGMADLLGSGPSDRWLALTSLSFDISGLELFLPLVTGGEVVIASDVTATDGPAVNRLIRSERVSHVQATPSGWRILLDSGFPGCGVALTGGEALALALARELRPLVGRLYNVYGPTETTIWSTAAEIADPVDEITIGRPLANTYAYLLDEAGQPAPIGLAGELLLGGHGVAEGYLGQPDLTGQRFGPDPYGGGRLYRTGDECRFLPDGRLVYIGRKDGQVKLRGHRIELAEIEGRLLEHPGVAEAAVRVHGEHADARLVGYVVPRRAVPDPDELREHLARLFAPAMVPGQWVTLDRLPRTPNGKLDRTALPDPPRRPSVERTPAIAPADEVVEGLREIWQDILQIEGIDEEDDLFDLGGHSLSITRISSRIHQRFGVPVSLDTFFDQPTIAEIAQVVRAGLSR